MSDVRKPIYFAVTGATSTFLKLNLDPDLYNVGTLAEVGGFNTVANDAKIIPITKQLAIASGFVKEVKAKCESGAEPNIKTRTVPILVGEAKADTIRIDLKGKTLLLGQGASPKPWIVRSVA